jgi:hypothetical protein
MIAVRAKASVVQGLDHGLRGLSIFGLVLWDFGRRSQPIVELPTVQTTEVMPDSEHHKHRQLKYYVGRILTSEIKGAVFISCAP